eukprot:GHVN01081482.1.p2 GENE.GHVN01081482.1~~GHVN01081482.1.p2  ORF type:complete len:102 (-),score=8.79 GHVN01081482.1:873-1178(-)
MSKAKGGMVEDVNITTQCVNLTTQCVHLTKSRRNAQTRPQCQRFSSEFARMAAQAITPGGGGDPDAFPQCHMKDQILNFKEGLANYFQRTFGSGDILFRAI